MNIISKSKRFVKNNDYRIKIVIFTLVVSLTFLSMGLFLGLYIGDERKQEEISSIEAKCEEQIETVRNEMDTALEELNAVHNSEMLHAKMEFDDHLASDLVKETIYQERIRELENTIEELESARSCLEVELDEKHKQLIAIEYPDASQVWMSLKGEGLSDAICAGIMGNIMAEVGGQTLDISYWKKQSPNDSYYGICQWNRAGIERMLKGYGSNLRAQINFLIDELYRVFPEGHIFYSLEDEKEVALYFAKYFEKCGTGSYNVRQKNATKALEYFCGSH